jgi:dynein heavy chain
MISSLGVDIPHKTDLEFEAIIEKASTESRLCPEEVFILEVVQLSQLLEIRHCVFVMGPPGAGKSSVWKTLAKTQDKAVRKILAVDVNPKVVSTRYLYGCVTPAKEWKEGLLSKTMRVLSVNIRTQIQNGFFWMVVSMPTGLIR